MRKLFWLLIVLITGIAHAQLATDCTMYASPTGNDNNNGTTPATPKTFQGAANAASSSGSVICLEGGTYPLNASFGPPNSGSGAGQGSGPPDPTNVAGYIKYEGYGDSPAILQWTGVETSGNYMIKIDAGCANGSFCGAAYVHFDNFTLDGSNKSRSCLNVRHTHHIIATRMTTKNCGSGMGGGQGDYYYYDHNTDFHSGWDSGITQNLSAFSIGASCFFDNYAGLHQVISNNIISGHIDMQTPVTDGNGLTQDQPCAQNSTTAPTPSVLWLNNVAYTNGGRCFIGNWNTQAYFINNTCYKNMLETIPNYSNGSQGEVTAHAVDKYWFINNIVYGWPGGTGNPNPTQFSYKNAGATNLTVPNNTNLWFILAPDGISNTFLTGDPLFTNPPSVNATSTCTSTTACPNVANAVDPTTITNQFFLKSGSPAIGAGIDPTTAAGIVGTQVATDMATYVYKDINGVPRTAGSWDLGAYQTTGGATPPSAPSGLTATVQ